MVRKKKRVFDIELLYSILIRDNAVLTDEYDSVKSSTNITYICSCGEVNSKKFHSIVDWGGAFCFRCAQKNGYEKMKQTNITRYGVSHSLQNAEFMNKKNNTTQQRFGVISATQNSEIANKISAGHRKRTEEQKQRTQNKIKDTCIQKYNKTSIAHVPEIREKRRATCIQKYGVPEPMQSTIFREKSLQTCIAKYGVPFPNQSVDVLAKTQAGSYKYKDYTMPSGDIRRVQGYEPYALDLLLKEYTEDQIITSRKQIPRIRYTVENKIQYYFPDIFIPSTNTIIEVKSIWSFQHTLHFQLKADATRAAGYTYETWIFDGKGNRVSEPT